MAASLDATLTSDLDFNLTVHRVEQSFSLKTDTLGLGMFFDSSPEFFSENTYDERTTGAKGRLVWTKGRHTAILGIDGDRGTLDQTLRSGPFLQMIGVSPTSAVQPDVTRWAIYANDTIAFDRWTITPGIRYDHNSIVGAFVSPSLGVACRLGEHSLARASVARGFTQPPLSLSHAPQPVLSPNTQRTSSMLFNGFFYLYP